MRRHGFASLQDERCHRAHSRGGGPKAARGWTVLSGQFSLRAVDSAEQITEMGRLTRARIRFLRRRWCLLCAIGRFRNSEKKGRSARMARSLNHIAATDLRAAWMEKCNRANITGNGTETALGSSVSSLWASSPAGQPSLPGSQQRPRRQRGAWSSLFSGFRIFSACVVTYAEK